MKCKICNKEFSSNLELTTHLVKEHGYVAEDLYKYYGYNFESKEAICPICGKSFMMDSRQLKKHKEGIAKAITCGRKCASAFVNLVYGNPSTRPEVKEKKKQSSLKKYGVENVFQAKEIKQKSKETNLRKRGVEYAMQSQEVKEKSKEVNLEKYGVEHVSQREDIKERKKNKSLEKYGVENISQADEVKEKKKQKSLEKFGTEYVLQAPEVREKGKRKNLEKYNVEYDFQAEEVKKKIKEKCLKEYGVEWPSQTLKSIENKKKTSMERYGVPYSIMSSEVIEKSKKTNLKNYGVEYFCQHERCIKANHSRISKINKKFQKLLERNNVVSDLEYIIENVGYDLKVENKLIELNPCFTHNVTRGPSFSGKAREPISVNYHLNKTLFAKEHGYNCIHVFDWDDKSKIIGMLINKNEVQADKCNIKEIDKDEAVNFLNNFHVQGSTEQLEYAYGLFYEDKLVEVMTFGKPRYNKNYEYELLRLCTETGLTVIGGANKLLSYFEEQVKPKSIISYCDLSKFNGEVYEKLGFKLKDQSEPAKHWYNPKTKRHITDNLLRQRGFDQLHKANFGKGTSNEELMKEHGYVEIYDCGQLVFVK